MTRLLDISRTLRRAGRGLTGIDRVELAYLRRLSAEPDDFFALARTRFGYVLLDRAGAVQMLDRFEQDSYGALDAWGYVPTSTDRPVRQAEADLRRLARARCLPQRLHAMLQAHCPRRLRYLNTGHANFTERVISALKGLDAHIAVLLHDVIPLDAPQWQRAGTAQRFRQFVQRVDRFADLVICNSEDTARRAGTYLSGPAPRQVAHLGVETGPPGALPTDLPPQAPFFVSLGTIEPRKNHALLLDLWRDLGDSAPTLVIVGRRGWNNEEVFLSLDQRPPRVLEVSGLDDGAVRALLVASNGLLFPSHLEGFGLPAMEAAALGVPVVCQPLPALREVLGDIPIYVDGSDAYLWREQIEALSRERRRPPVFRPPSWEDHFNAVLSLT